jgi:6-phosphogluconolactonase
LNAEPPNAERRTPPTTEIIVRPAADLARIFAARAAAVARAAHEEGRSCALVLPGGSVAEQFFPVLAEADLDWRRVDWFWGDERAVPPDHLGSNFRLANELLFSRVAIDSARVHRMKGEANDLERAAADYEAELKDVLGATRPFDLILLGVGPDGHVCSLFPGHPALQESARLVVAVADAPKPPPRRLTLTLPAFAQAFIVIAAFGSSKAAAIRDALKNPDSRLPVALAARAARHTLFLLDEEAGMSGVRP